MQWFGRKKGLCEGTCTKTQSLTTKIERWLGKKTNFHQYFLYGGVHCMHAQCWNEANLESWSVCLPYQKLRHCVCVCTTWSHKVKAKTNMNYDVVYATEENMRFHCTTVCMKRTGACSSVPETGWGRIVEQYTTFFPLSFVLLFRAGCCVPKKVALNAFSIRKWISTFTPHRYRVFHFLKRPVNDCTWQSSPF